MTMGDNKKHVFVDAYLLIGLILIGLSASGCRSSRDIVLPPSRPSTVSYTVVSDTITSDVALEGLIAPYRQNMQASVSEVIGRTTAPLTKGHPEGSLGNMAADAMLEVVQHLVEKRVDMALTNNGGLRVSDLTGEITVGKIFELMPFDNLMTVLDLNGVQIDSLVHQIARVGGEPVAGFSFTVIDPSGTVQEIKVRGISLDPEKRYRIVTSDYMANGGGNLPVLWEPLAREDLSMLLRDAFLQYIRQTQTISPVLDGRISFVSE